jgi:hypothetical protein
VRTILPHKLENTFITINVIYGPKGEAFPLPLMAAFELPFTPKIFHQSALYICFSSKDEI